MVVDGIEFVSEKPKDNRIDIWGGSSHDGKFWTWVPLCILSVYLLMHVGGSSVVEVACPLKRLGQD